MLACIPIAFTATLVTSPPSDPPTHTFCHPRKTRTSISFSQRSGSVLAARGFWNIAFPPPPPSPFPYAEPHDCTVIVLSAASGNTRLFPSVPSGSSFHTRSHDLWCCDCTVILHSPLASDLSGHLYGSCYCWGVLIPLSMLIKEGVGVLSMLSRRWSWLSMLSRRWTWLSMLSRRWTWLSMLNRRWACSVKRGTYWACSVKRGTYWACSKGQSFDWPYIHRRLGLPGRDN